MGTGAVLTAPVIAAAAVGAAVASGFLYYEHQKNAELKEQERLAGEQSREALKRRHDQETATAKAKASGSLPRDGLIILEDEDANEVLVDRQRREEARRSGTELGQAKSKLARDDTGEEGGVGVPPRAPGFVPPGEGGQRDIEVDRRHRRGDQQVTVDGQSWHVAPGVDAKTLPASDAVGDRLQAATSKAAAKWDRSVLSIPEREAIRDAHAAGEPWRANLLEQQARGRWVESRVKAQFPDLKWQAKGVDAVDPKTGVKYEVLSGTRHNVDAHAKRMSQETFRMIKF